MTEPRYTDIDSLNHDPHLAQALGNMVTAWARAETAMANVFACVADLHFNTAMIAYYRIPTFESRTKVLLAMIDAWDTKSHDPDEVGDAVQRLAKLSSARNHWIYGVWCTSTEKNETVVFDFRAPDTSNKRRKPVKTADVHNHINAVQQRTATLDHLIPLYYGEWPTSP